MGGEQLGFCFPKGALEQKQSWFRLQHHFCLSAQSSSGDPEVPSRAGITPLAPAHSLSAEVNSTKALGFLPFSPHLQQWGGEVELRGSGELRAPCGKCRRSTQGSVEVAVAGRNHAHVSSEHICTPGVPRLRCSPVCRDRGHLTCLIGTTYLQHLYEKPQGSEYLVACKHCCMSDQPPRSKYAGCFPSLHLVQQMKEMLAEHCGRSSRYRGPYHLCKDEKNLFGKGWRKPRHLKVSVCLTLSNMELCSVGLSKPCLC